MAYVAQIVKNEWPFTAKNIIDKLGQKWGLWSLKQSSKSISEILPKGESLNREAEIKAAEIHFNNWQNFPRHTIQDDRVLNPQHYPPPKKKMRKSIPKVKKSFEEKIELGELLMTGKKAYIEYVDFHGEVTEREITNWKYYENYIVGYCLLRHEKRTFKVDRILNWSAE